jgi:K+-transporting ATPase KdpF subunit
MTNAKGLAHGGFYRTTLHRRFFFGRDRLRDWVSEDMSLLDLILGIVLATGLTAYLIYALIRPEKF